VVQNRCKDNMIVLLNYHNRDKWHWGDSLLHQQYKYHYHSNHYYNQTNIDHIQHTIGKCRNDYLNRFDWRYKLYYHRNIRKDNKVSLNYHNRDKWHWGDSLFHQQYKNQHHRNHYYNQHNKDHIQHRLGNWINDWINMFDWRYKLNYHIDWGNMIVSLNY